MKFIKRYQRIIGRSIVSLASLFVIFLCVAHITIPLISPHTDYFEKLLGRTLHYPVAIRQVNFGWRGLDPQLRFSDIAVNNPESKQKILTIKKLNFSIGFFSSLWHREILPSAISISGAQLDLYQNQDGSWEFLNNQKNSVGNVTQISDWILTQSRISLSNINLTVHYADGVALVIQQLQLELKQKYYPSMSGTFFLSSGGRVDFSWRWSNSSFALLHSQLHLKIRNLLLEPWLNSSMAALGINKMPLLSGLVNGEAWLNWRSGKFSELHAIVSSPNLSEFSKGVKPVKFSADFFVKNGDISGYFDIDDISRLKQFIPDNLSERAKLWLSNAFLAGSVSHAALNWLSASRQFNLILPVKNATLHFAPGWPDVKNINALLTFKNKSLVIDANSGEISGNPIIHAVTVIPDVTQSVMTIDSQTGGTLQNGLDFLAAAPLPIAPFVTGWQAEGSIIIDLHLAINLKNTKNKVDSSGVVHFNNTNLFAPKKAMSWNKIQGELHFEDNKLTGNNLSGEFLNSPVVVNLKAVVPYKALLRLSLQNQHTALLLDAYSNLIGLTSTLPAPLTKSEKTALPLHFHLRSQANQNYLVSMNLANIFSVIAEIKNKSGVFELLRGTINVGKDNAALRKSQGLSVVANLALLNLDDWQAVWSSYKKSLNVLNPQNKIILNWHSAVINIKKIIYQDHAILGNHYVMVLQKNSRVFTLKNNLLSGSVIISNEKNKAPEANFDYIDWPLWWKSKGEADPRKIPSLNLVCKLFSYHARPVGELNFSVTNMEKGLKINSLIIKSKNYIFQVSGAWLSLPNEATHLVGDISTQNLGVLLVTFGASPVVYQGYGTANFDLHWAAAPAKITAGGASGQLSFSFNDGRIMKLSQQAESDLGLGKLLNLLSLQSLPFTIASGFQSLGEKGFEFNELKGSIDLVNGKGTIKSLSLVGPIAWVTATGNIDFSKKLYDLQLTVIPNITSSIPLILAIASGPIAGVIGLVANKILGSQIGKAAEQNITVKGSWKNPSVLKLPKPQTTKAG